MKRLFTLIAVVAFLASFSVKDASQKKQYEDNRLKCIYGLKDGRISGPYTSWYKNGQKRAEGTFDNNYRTGTWTVWDSTGRMRMQRVYENPLVYKEVVPTEPSDKAVKPNEAPYTLQYNKDGYIDYFDLHEKMIDWQKRVWRFIPSENNDELFDNNFYQTLLAGLKNKTITSYKEDNFKEIKSAIDSFPNKLIGYRMKEDWFFDNDRLVMEARPIALAPVVVNTATNDTLTLCWLYFPQLRKYLAKEKVKSPDTSTKIKTLDDLFFFRDFYSEIYNEGDVFNRKLPDYLPVEKRAKETQRIEISIIEAEHDIWLSYAK